jgi:RNA polymerase sigma-70 factor (ECF subfamily)
MWHIPTNGPMRLFGPLTRIPVRMSATISCLAANRPAFLSSALMTDDSTSIALGLRRRDPQLVDRLIELYQFRLFRYLLFITSSKERAEDFFQETWIRVLERGHQYDGKSKFEAWLFAIARHLVIDWQRQKKMQSLDELTDPASENPREFTNDREPSPLTQVLSSEEQSVVQSSLTRIPAIYREILLLRFQEEMQIEEMAGVLSIPISTVKSRLYRGLDALRNAMPSRGGAA